MPDDSRLIRDVPLQTREATVVPASVKPDARTIDVCWTTGARVQRFDWWTGTRYDEELVVDDASCDLSALNSGAGVLDSHQRWSLETHIGRVERAWIEGGKGYATLRFADTPEVESTWRKIETGIITKVSVGYTVRKFEITKEDGKPDLWRAVDWLPREISMVSVPADVGAGTRSEDKLRVFPCEFINRADAAHKPEGTMPDNKPKETAAPADPAATRTDPNPGAATAPAAATPPAPANDAARSEDTRRLVDEGIANERTRQKTIRDNCRTAGLDDDFADGLVERGVNVADASKEIFNKMAERSGSGTRPRISGVVDHTDPAQISGRLVDAMVARATRFQPKENGRIEMPEHSRQFATFGILDALAEIASARGLPINLRQPKAAIYDQLVEMRALSTSDFPILLANVGHKLLISAYTLAQPTYKLVFGRKTFTDFKPHSFIRVGDFPNLLEKGETGEYKYGSFGEAETKITIVEYGRMIEISRKMIINDDLGVFADIGRMAGRRVAFFENALAWAQLALNSGGGPNITEKGTTQVLFHADHGNLGSSAAIDVASIGAGRARMQAQKSIDGLALNPMPRFLVTSPTKATLAEQFCANNQLIYAKSSDYNPYAGKLTPISDANLTGNPWYLACDPADVETFVYGYLDGSEGPRMAAESNFTTDGTRMKVAEDFVAGAIDWRGWDKNPGA